MTKKNTPALKTSSETKDATEPTASTPKKVEETPFEAVASICSILVIGLFILTFLGQNFVIPSGSMENTLLIGDHLLVDRITLAPSAKWMPFVHYREPQRGDIVVFIKPVADMDESGNPQYLFLVKRLIGVPGDHIHLHSGVVSINGVEQKPPVDSLDTSPDTAEVPYLDEFPTNPPSSEPQATEAWSIDFPNHAQDGDLVVPPGKYFMMGDHRHNSLDSRYWGFVPRENILGRPVLNYWSFKTPADQSNKTGMGDTVAWLGHVALHFFSDTRWSRTLHRVR